MHPNRRTARESVMKSLYALEISHDSLEHVLNTSLKPALKEDKSLLDFAEQLFLKTVRDTKMLDGIIIGFVSNWDIKRIALIDKCTMRMAICEMMQFSDIPTKVTINEAIEIAKKFSTDNSGKFVNGILDAASEKLTAEGKIKKTGAGLMESTVARKKS